MSSLSEQLNSFRNKVKSNPAFPKKPSSTNLNSPQFTNVKRDTPEYDSSSLKGNSSPKRKKGLVFSQPANTGTGVHLGTQVVEAIKYIKSRDGPVEFKEIERYMSTPIDQLLPRLRRNDRIRIDNQKLTATYVSIFNIYSKEELLTFLRSQQTFQGIPIKQLKDGWNGCLAAVDELETSGDILVLRTKKENTPRYVWANTGGKLGGLDEEFVNIWNHTKVPDSADLPKELEKAHLKPTSVDPATIKSNKKSVSEKKQRKPRRGKITNTHLAGILKDYGS